MKHASLLAGSLALTGVMVPLSAQADLYFERSGKIGVEARIYTADPQWDGQDGRRADLSLASEPQFYWEWNDANDSIRFTPFVRHDSLDAERSHRDIRELSWIHVMDNYELRAGIRKVYWGKTEFVHLVDVINQTDMVEDIDGEDKLGQPMINLSRVSDWGIVDLFVLPGFRERTMPGVDGRLRPGLVIATDDAEYESAAKQRHVDLAIRWSHSIDLFDIGLHAFRGTNRDPQLRAGLVDGELQLIPYYEQMTQFGIDGQATIDSWLWKLEARYRHTSSDDYLAMQGGFEYTFYGLFESSRDLGVLLEYGRDQRGRDADSISQNDLYAGGRLAWNDEADSQLLAGVGYDLDYGSASLMAEASRRIGNQWKVGADVRIFQADNERDSLWQIRRDDHVQLTLEYYF